MVAVHALHLAARETLAAAGRTLRCVMWYARIVCFFVCGILDRAAQERRHTREADRMGDDDGGDDLVEMCREKMVGIEVPQVSDMKRTNDNI